MEKKSKTNDNNNENEMKMISVMTWRFKEFQQQIFPVIQSITKKPAVKEHPFTQRWVKALKNPHNITYSSTLRMVSKAFNFNLDDVNDYQKLLQTAPVIDKYVLFEDNKKTGNGFLFELLTPPLLDDTHKNMTVVLDNEKKITTTVTVDDNINQKSVTAPSGDESITTNATHH